MARSVEMSARRVAAMVAAFGLSAVGLTATLPAGAAAQIDLRVRADPAGRDEQNLNGEYVLVSNDGTTPLDLSGWRVCDAIVTCYYFPTGTSVGPGGDLRVHTGSGQNTLRALYMGRDRPMWANWADIVTLSDADGVVRARCVYDRGRGLDCSPP